MKSKKIISLLLAVLLLISLAACGSKDGSKDTGVAEPDEGSKEPIKIGIMQFGEFDALLNASEGFKAGLAEAGFIEGENVVFNYLSAAADTSNCPTIADSLINDGSDLIFAIATPSVLCLKEKTTTIPVIFSAVTDPVQSGLIADYDAPGGNISGASDMNPVKEQIDFLLELLPETKTIAVFYSSSESNSRIQYEMAKSHIEGKGLTCVQKTISAVDEAKSAIESLKGQVDAIYIPTDNTVSDAMQIVSTAAHDCGIPTFGAEPAMVANGAFASYGVNYFELGKQSAVMAVKVLQSDDPLAEVAKMPVVYQTENLTTAINATAAEKLGIEIPQEILDSAEVIK